MRLFYIDVKIAYDNELLDIFEEKILALNPFMLQ